jgi:hypothetical protein
VLPQKFYDPVDFGTDTSAKFGDSVLTPLMQPYPLPHFLSDFYPASGHFRPVIEYLRAGGHHQKGTSVGTRLERNLASFKHHAF